MYFCFSCHVRTYLLSVNFLFKFNTLIAVHIFVVHTRMPPVYCMLSKQVRCLFFFFLSIVKQEGYSVQLPCLSDVTENF